MTEQVFFSYVFPAFMVAILGLFLFAVVRGRRVIAANERIVQGQNRQIEQTERGIEIQERQAQALERIAIGLEQKSKDTGVN